MTNQEILDNAPTGATHVGCEFDYYRQPEGEGSYYGMHKGKWSRLSAVGDFVRSLDDIKRIVELEDEVVGLSAACESLHLSDSECTATEG